MAANDLDLDELHEAVNALMVDAGKGKTKKKPTSVVSTPSEPTKPQPPKEAPAPKIEQSERIEVRRPLPTISSGRARGRTMDVVGPKPVAPKVAPSAQTKRQAPTLQPTSPTVVPEPPKPVIAAAPQSQTQSAQEPADDVLASIDMKQEHHAPTLTHQKNEWPDPLDVHGFKDEPEEEVKAATDPELVGKPVTPIKPDPDDARPEEHEPEESYEESNSPFVTTKVEKRPLGAYADAVPPPASVAEPSKPEPASIATQQPKEFSPEVVAVESSEPEFHQDPPTDHTDMHELRQMSIPQQYQQAEKLPAKDNRPVFDTKEYHPPIEAAHAAHRTGSSLGWIMILVFTIILVVAVVFAYYMITGSLDITQLMS